MRRSAAGLVAAGLLVAACGAAHTAAPTTAPPTTTSTPLSPSAPVPSSSYIPPTLPTPATSGPLTATAVAPFPGTAVGVLAAEAPDGTVFAVPLPASGEGTVAYVVDGTSAPQVAEHLDAPVVAVAADSGYFYAATTRDVTSYDRTTGAPVRTWRVTLAGDEGQGDVAFAGGRLWLYTALGTLVEIDPASATPRVVASPGADVEGIAADATGAYLVEPGGRTLVHVSTSGVVTTAPTGLTVNVALSGPAAVTPVTVVGHTLVVAQHPGQGLDAELVTYDASSLAPLAQAATTVQGANVVPTLTGPVVAGDSIPVCPGAGDQGCVARVTLATATYVPAYAVPAHTVVSAVLGPYPAVITDSGSGLTPGTLRLLRLR